jgi:hypothetical protein
VVVAPDPELAAGVCGAPQGQVRHVGPLRDAPP